MLVLHHVVAQLRSVLYIKQGLRTPCGAGFCCDVINKWSQMSVTLHWNTLSNPACFFSPQASTRPRRWLSILIKQWDAAVALLCAVIMAGYKKYIYIYMLHKQLGHVWSAWCRFSPKRCLGHSGKQSGFGSQLIMFRRTGWLGSSSLFLSQNHQKCGLKNLNKSFSLRSRC